MSAAAVLVEGRVSRPDADIAYEVQGPPDAPAVVMTHSILSSRMMWAAQAALLVRRGLRVVRVDARGHGASHCRVDACTMDDLAADTLAVLDALAIAKAHYVGLSLGGMSGLCLGIAHPGRLLSLVLCAARADAPPAVAAPWDERIAQAQAQQSCAGLAPASLERWFGQPFLDAHPEIATRFREQAAATQVRGFVACARAIQGLDYLDRVARIGAPTTLIVGRRDGVLPEAMQALQARIAGSALEVIDGAGHLPNIDQPAAFDAALQRHFDRVLPEAMHP